MKRTLSIVCLLVLTLGVWAGGAAAYTFNDTTLVREYWGATSTNNWMDVIGDSSVYDTFGANWSGGTLTIYTNWNPGKDGDLNEPKIKTADLFIYGTILGDVAIRLDSNGQGTVFINPTSDTSYDIFSTTGYGYGAYYDKSNPKLVPVTATSAASAKTATVTWSSVDKNVTDNNVVIDLAGVGIKSFDSFVWGTATCSNDGFSAAPIPGTLVLLGSSLLGLVGAGLRKKVNC
jgi:hypothetical protein